jgi:hypothetical protein
MPNHLNVGWCVFEWQSRKYRFENPTTRRDGNHSPEMRTRFGNWSEWSLTLRHRDPKPSARTDLSLVDIRNMWWDSLRKYDCCHWNWTSICCRPGTYLASSWFIVNVHTAAPEYFNELAETEFRTPAINMASDEVRNLLEPVALKFCRKALHSPVIRHCISSHCLSTWTNNLLYPDNNQKTARSLENSETDLRNQYFIAILTRAVESFHSWRSWVSVDLIHLPLKNVADLWTVG